MGPHGEVSSLCATHHPSCSWSSHLTYMDKILPLLIMCASQGCRVCPAFSSFWSKAMVHPGRSSDLCWGGSAELNTQHLSRENTLEWQFHPGHVQSYTRSKQEFNTTEVPFEPGRVKLSIKEKNRNEMPFSNSPLNNKDFLHRVEYHSHVTASHMLQHFHLGKCHFYSLVHFFCSPRSLIIHVC